MKQIIIGICLLLTSNTVLSNMSHTAYHKEMETALLQSSSTPRISGDNIYTPDPNYYPYGKTISILKSYNTNDFNDDYGTAAKDICISFEISRLMKIQFSTKKNPADIPNSNIYLLKYSGGDWSINTTVIDKYTKEIAFGQDELLIENLSPGKYYLYVEGRTTDNKVRNGLMKVSVSGTCVPRSGDNIETAINLGTLSHGVKFMNIQNTSEYEWLPAGQIPFGDDYGTSSNDVFYKFNIVQGQGPLDVIATHKDQSTGVIDTYIYLLDASGQLIESNDDYYGTMPYMSFMQQAYIKRRLDPGTYYVVSEGNGSNSTICTIIEGIEPDKNDVNRNKIDSYIKTFSAISDDNMQCEYLYFDGLGKASEVVKMQFTPDRKDLVVYNAFDPVNKISRQWLPVPTSNNSGAFVPESDIKELAESFYMDSRAFTETQLEHSAIGRPEKQISPGVPWLEHPSVKTYDFNAGNEVKCFQAGTDGQLYAQKYYGAGTLHKTVSTDEDGKKVTEYKSKGGRTVMLRSDTDVDTYYVYNDLGQLVYVLPPLAADGLPVRNAGYPMISSAIANYAYLYKYDERGNCIDKKLPGCGSIYLLYDKANRLVATQDANQRTKKQWTIIKYDGLGRQIYTGILNREIAESEKDNIHKNLLFTEEKGTSNQLGNTGYTCNYFVKEITPLAVTYYDDYSFPDAGGKLAYQGKPGYGVQYIVNGVPNAKGLITGARVYLLDGSGAYASSVNYYDDKNFAIQTRATNHMGGYDIVYSDIDFMGNYKRTLSEHNIAIDGVQQPVISEQYFYTYDHAGRLTKTVYQINDRPAVTLTDLTAGGSYDKLGRVTAKKRHNGMNSESLAYNIRGWIRKVQSGDFAEDLYYETNPQNQNPCYNGNISCLTWSYEGQPKKYTFIYDKLNRLKSAESTENSEYFTYDKTGNILTINRASDRTSSRNIDQLSFKYNGNQISWITDNAGVYNIYGLKEFTNLYDYNDEYAYDANGNTTKDLNREIVTIKYNLLNLPELVQFKNGNQIVNRYDAAGRKLGTEYFTRLTPLSVPLAAGQVITQSHDGTTVDQRGTAYAGNKEYSTAKGVSANTKLDKLHNSEGYVTAIADPWYSYFCRDHLGSIRAVWKYSSYNDEFAQATQYYPSGLPWWSGRMPETQNRKYNGKEFVEAHGYDSYDYGARTYYPAIMRFISMDPLAEKYYSISPYAYCNNNPVNAIDPDGRSTYVLRNDDGTYRVVGGSLADHDKNIYAFSAGKNGELVKTSIGLSSSITSFYDSDEGVWGGTINPNDQSGKKFLDNFVQHTLEIGDYMDNAKRGQQYDFKRTNGTGKEVYSSNEDFYRGMPVGKTKEGQVIYTSARDVGNIAAGYMAGVYGIPWVEARKEFDKLQSAQDGRPSVEGISTQNAQRVGYDIGYKEALRDPIGMLLRWVNSIPTIYKRYKNR
ncbi:MAG: RHS repeat-associated core domain-containing protein [Dysgonamonadaceae bacterium]